MRRRSGFRTAATVICIILLVGVLGGLFYYDRMVQRARIRRSEAMSFVEESDAVESASMFVNPETASGQIAASVPPEMTASA